MSLYPGSTLQAEAELLEMPSWAGQDYAPFISPDGRYLIYQSDRPAPHEASNLWYVINENSADRLGPAQFTVPRPLRFPLEGSPSATMKAQAEGSRENPHGYFQLNTDGFEGMPFVLFDTKGIPVEIFYTSVADSRTGRPGFSGLNLYHARYRDDRWEKPEHLNILNSQFDERMPSLSADGKRIFFSSNRPGGYGGFDIYFSERDLQSGRWARPVNLGPIINSAYDENSPSLVDDLLVWSSNRPGGLGYFDLYSSFWNGENWSRAENVGAPFNSHRDDEYFSVTQDRLWAYFVSDRSNQRAPGEMDLYRAPFPERLRSLFNILFTGQILDGTTRKLLGVEATLSIRNEFGDRVIRSRVFIKNPGEETDNFGVELQTGRVYRVSISAPGFHPTELDLDYTGNLKSGRIDRHTIVLQPIRPETTPADTDFTVTGIVLDDATEERLPAARLEWEQESRKQTIALSAEATFVVRVKPGQPFLLRATHQGYQNYEASFEAGPGPLIIRLKKSTSGPDSGVTDGPCQKEEPTCLEQLFFYFELDKSDIRPEDTRWLDLAARILQKHPEIRLEIQGHTDRRFTYQYNLALSEARARAVRQGLVSRGVAANRLEVKGYSFSRILSREEEDRNRRVQFQILKGASGAPPAKPVTAGQKPRTPTTGVEAPVKSPGAAESEKPPGGPQKEKEKQVKDSKEPVKKKELAPQT